MRNTKKTPEEKAATRKAQNERAAKRKAEQGLQRVFFWAPKEALEAGKALNRVGIIFAAPDAPQDFAAYLRHPDGRLEPIPYQVTLAAEPAERKKRKRRDPAKSAKS